MDQGVFRDSFAPQDFAGYTVVDSEGRYAGHFTCRSDLMYDEYGVNELEALLQRIQQRNGAKVLKVP